uniref:Uncharacterized protein n=1 Tax=Anguilla anguilla TaxID=7936 RepID=A0A0E9SFM4_ANGAN
MVFTEVLYSPYTS